MTIEEVEKSVYVGGLPYDTTEDSLRKTFNYYGHVTAVKINNEGLGGKCYGFVTFTNPQAAVDAIRDMNGRTFGGRVVRVNEVKVRGGRANNNREGFRNNFERSLSERGRDQERENAHYENQPRVRERDRSRDQGRDREREFFRENNNRDQERDRSMDRYREQSSRRSMEEDDREREREQEWERDHNLERDRKVVRNIRHHNCVKDDNDEELYKTNGFIEANKLNKKSDVTRNLSELNAIGSRFGDQRNREHSSESRDNDYVVEDELKDANQHLEELRKQVSEMEGFLDDKQLLVSKLQAESQILDDALTAAEKLASHQQKKLVKLSRCYLLMKSYDEKLKSSEKELQSLVDTTVVEVDDGDDLR